MMTYDIIKVLHIISAAILLAGMIYASLLWKKIQQAELISQKLQAHTCFLIVPLAIFQLATGFTMISLKHDDLSQFWIESSLMSFFILMMSWFAFLLLNSFTVIDNKKNKMLLLRRAQSILLMICGLALFTMIFFMANKIL